MCVCVCLCVCVCVSEYIANILGCVPLRETAQIQLRRAFTYVAMYVFVAWWKTHIRYHTHVRVGERKIQIDLSGTYK